MIVSLFGPFALQEKLRTLSPGPETRRAEVSRQQLRKQDPDELCDICVRHVASDTMSQDVRNR